MADQCHSHFTVVTVSHVARRSSFSLRYMTVTKIIIIIIIMIIMIIIIIVQ
jgi:hypothetical protein